MIEKLEDMMGFVFKVVKWIVMIGLIVFTVIMYKSCNRTIDIINEPIEKPLSRTDTIEANKKIRE